MTEPNKDYPKPLTAWYMVGLLLVIYSFSFIDRQILGLLGPAIKADFGISDGQFGLLTGFGFSIFYTGFGLICARMADQGSRKWLIAGGLFLWSLMTAASGLARNFSQLFLMRMGVGVGEATLAPAANSLLADSFPKERLATALSIYSMGIPIGAGIAFILGGAVIGLADQIPDIPFWGLETLKGWQKSFFIVGLPGIFLTLLVFTIHEPSRKGLSKTDDPANKALLWRHLRAHKRAYIGVILGVSANAAISFGMAIWITFFFFRKHGMTPADIGLYFGLISMFGGSSALLFLGWLSDHWFKKGLKDAPVRAMMIAPLGFGLPAFFFPQVDSLLFAWILVAIANFFMNTPSGVAYASLQLITPNQIRGRITAIYVLAASLIGYGGGSFLIGLLSDLLSQNAADSASGVPLANAISLTALLATPLCFGLYLWSRKAYAHAVREEEARIAGL